MAPATAIMAMRAREDPRRSLDADIAQPSLFIFARVGLAPDLGVGEDTPERGFNRYIANVIMPIITASADDGTLAVFLNRQLDEWELEAERPEGEPFADQVVAHLTKILAELRERIADAVVGKTAALTNSEEATSRG